jgi:isochorismate synthase
MPKVFTYTSPLPGDALDAFCILQKGFTDQFVYYRKDRPLHFFGLGRCIAFASREDMEYECEGLPDVPPVLFTFNRFDAENPKPADPLFSAFPRLRLLLPEVVLIENEEGAFLQVNSLGPVYPGRVERFSRHADQAPQHTRVTIPYTLEPDSPEVWGEHVKAGLDAIETGRLRKIVLSRRRRLVAAHPFSSKDLLVNLIDGPAQGTAFLYRYGDVFFCGCTPELLVRKQGSQVESMCLAGTIRNSDDAAERQSLAQELFADEKNRREHEHVVDFLRAVMGRNCYGVDIPAEPTVVQAGQVQHLMTPVSANMLEGRTLENLASQLSPTPALAGAPVGEALMAIREIEDYNRGFFGGTVGYVDGTGDGELSVAIRSGVFDGEMGWCYAGCGIVQGSEAASEYDEIDLKLKAILTAFDGEACHD